MSKQQTAKEGERTAPQFEADLPPLPFSYLTNSGGNGNPGFVYILDANGRKIASIWGKPSEKIAVAELICDASDEALSRSHP